VALQRGLIVGATFRFTLIALFVIGSVQTASASKLTTVFAFRGGTSGTNPEALIAGPNGSFFGVTQGGGDLTCGRGGGCGVVFQLLPSKSGYSETVLARFTGTEPPDPTGLVYDARASALYGTTYQAGEDGWGTVYRVALGNRAAGLETLYNFKGSTDGGMPTDLIEAADGSLYGSTLTGGASKGGVVFKLTPAAGAFVESVIYAPTVAEGSGPGPIQFGAGGTILGSTVGGGTTGNGVVFRLTPGANGYTAAILYNFLGSPNSAGEASTFAFGANGRLLASGRGGNCIGQNECEEAGAIFELVPSVNSYAETLLYAFRTKHDGFDPSSPLALGSGGVLYGTTYRGTGPYTSGTIYSLTPHANGYVERVLYTFPEDYSYPFGWVAGVHGSLFGATRENDGDGTVFRFDP
jgi:uncharacterized repeat protein (TIGR03803 family)